MEYKASGDHAHGPNCEHHHHHHLAHQQQPHHQHHQHHPRSDFSSVPGSRAAVRLDAANPNVDQEFDANVETLQSKLADLGEGMMGGTRRLFFVRAPFSLTNAPPRHRLEHHEPPRPQRLPAHPLCRAAGQGAHYQEAGADLRGQEGGWVVGVVWFVAAHLPWQDVRSQIDDNQNHRQQTPLHWACTKNELASVIVLIELGANPNVADVDGYTPILTAIQYDCLAIVHYLSEVRGGSCRLRRRDRDAGSAARRTSGRARQPRPLGSALVGVLWTRAPHGVSARERDERIE